MGERGGGCVCYVGEIEIPVVSGACEPTNTFPVFFPSCIRPLTPSPFSHQPARLPQRLVLRHESPRALYEQWAAGGEERVYSLVFRDRARLKVYTGKETYKTLWIGALGLLFSSSCGGGLCCESILSLLVVGLDSRKRLASIITRCCVPVVVSLYSHRGSAYCNGQVDQDGPSDKA